MSAILKEEVIVYKDPTDNQPLLERKGDGRFYIPLSTVTPAKLGLLSTAIACAISALTGQALKTETLTLPATPSQGLN